MNNQESTGVVKWFNTNKGFGFITIGGDTDVFVHYTDIISDNFRNLSEGESVSFKLNQTKKGLRATEVLRLE